MRVPIEIVLDIFDALAASDDAHLSHSYSVCAHALRTCSLVCRAWALPAQRCLFQNVSLVAAAPGAFSTKKTIIKRFQALLSVLNGTSTLLSKSHFLAQCIHSFALLENSTFQDPSYYPLLRVSSFDFLSLLFLLPNVRSVKVRSGVLQFDRRCWNLLRSNSPHDHTRVAPLANVQDFAVVQERAAHRGCIESILCSGLLSSMTSLSWTSFDGLSADAYAYNLLPSSAHAANTPTQSFPPIKNALKRLTLDFRASGPPLGLLYTLLRSSIESQSLQALHLPHLPPTLPPTALRSLRAIDVPGNPVSSLPDIIRLLQPTLTTLSLGSQPSDISRPSSALPAWLAQGEGAFLTSVGNLGSEPLDLSEAAPQLETLICMSYPLESLLIGNALSPGSPSQLPRSLRSSYAMLGLGATSRLPSNLKALEVRLGEKALQNASVWSHIVDSVLSALSTNADTCNALLRGGGGVERVRLELPGHLLTATAEQSNGNAIGKKPRTVTANGRCNSGWQRRKNAASSDIDTLFIERLEALRVYCASSRVKLELTSCSPLSLV